jgi:hypothetical protein
VIKPGTVFDALISQIDLAAKYPECVEKMQNRLQEIREEK